MELEIGKSYEITFPKGDVTHAKLVHIQRYPAVGMPPDYNFEYLPGANQVFTPHPHIPNGFPLPEFARFATKFREIDPNGHIQTDEEFEVKVIDKKIEKLGEISIHSDSRFHAKLKEVTSEELTAEQLEKVKDILTERIKQLQSMKDE